MGIKAQRLFIVFALAVLILVIASFTAVVAGTFASVDPAAATYTANGSTAMTSILFIVIAAIFGFFVYRKNAKIGPATIVGIIGIVLIVVLGQFIGLHFSRTFWVLFIAVYVTVASLLPVWILLQPRDYLSSFLLYGMMIIAVISIVGATFTGAATVEAPAFYGWKNPAGQPLFPFLFITVACGACSGFHSLISSGTSSKQIDNEKDAQIIGYGSMIVESALGVISLIAIGVVWSQTSAGGGDKFQLSAPPTIFAGGIATMFASFAGEKSYAVIYNLFTLAVSVFALTSLDSATRLCRYLFAELLTPEGKTHEDLTGAAKFFTTPIVSTLIMVIIGCGMGFMALSQIWSVFGAANQLLASIAMLAVCTWLGKIGRNNKMFYFPMVFMLCATITALCFTIVNGFKTILAGAQWGTYFQVIWSIVLVVLAIDLAVMAFKTLAAQAKAKKA
jgi:carbon starvation protein